MVAVTEVLPPLVAVKAGWLPVPLAANPMEGSELVHAKVPPAGVLVKFPAATAVPLQTVLLAGTVTVGVGSTVMVYEEGVPVHPFAVGVTVMVPLMEAPVPLVPVNEGWFPVPLAPSPMAVLLLVHAKVPPAGVLVKFAAGTLTPLHTVLLAGTVTVGVGLTVMV